MNEAVLLPPQGRREAQRILADDLVLRLQIGKAPHPVRDLIASSEGLQDALWAHALRHGPQVESPPRAALDVQAHNEVFDLHPVRCSTDIVFGWNPAIRALLFGITSSVGILQIVLLVAMLSLQPGGNSVQRQCR